MNNFKSVAPLKAARVYKSDSVEKATSGGKAVFVITPWQRFQRFLVAGKPTASSCASLEQNAADFVHVIREVLTLDGIRAVNMACEISDQGRGVSNDAALFVLAMALCCDNIEVKKHAAAQVPVVARIGTDLLHLTGYINQMGGWSNLRKQAVHSYFDSKDNDSLAYDLTKYYNRDGFNYRDVLRLTHYKTDDPIRNAILKYATFKERGSIVMPESAPKYLHVVEAAKSATAKEVVDLITEHNIPREVISTELRKDVDVCKALLRKMGITATIRNLGAYTSYGVFNDSEMVNIVVGRLTNPTVLKRGRVHPVSVYLAMKMYGSGRGGLGTLTWTPNPAILQALKTAFDLAFGSIETTGKKFTLGLDVSGSMSCPVLGSPFISAREVAALMAYVTAKTEPNTRIFRFSNTINEMRFEASSLTLDQMLKWAYDCYFGSTDCSLLMETAIKEKADTDVFAVYTDNDTNCNRRRPADAWQDYVNRRGSPSLLCVAAVSVSDFSIADPKNPFMMDVPGFDSGTPNMIAGWTKAMLA